MQIYNGMIRKKILWFVLLSFGLTGCFPVPVVFLGAGAAGGVLGYKYYGGALTVVYQAPLSECWDASRRAVQNMKFETTSEKVDSMTGRIMAKRADGRPVIVALAYKSEQNTEVVIRVGVLGNKNDAAVVEQEISKILKRR